jgi:hypothetical protein
MNVSPFQILIVGTTLEEQQQQQLQGVSQFVAFSIFIGNWHVHIPFGRPIFLLPVSVYLCNNFRMPLSVVGNEC